MVVLDARLTQKEHNQARVLEVLRTDGALTRAELAARTGLSRATLSALADRLVSVGLAVEQDRAPERSGGRGRPARELRLTSRAGVVVGIAFGHSELWAASADLSGEILHERRLEIAVDNSAGTALAAAAEVLQELLLSSTVLTPPRESAGGTQVVMGLPCPIDARSGRVVTNNILPGWVDVQPAREMAQRTGQEVVIENDANLGAVGEWRFGAGERVPDLIYLKASTGIGAGLVLGGRLYRGATGTAGEVGHTQVNPDGATCRCGNSGCLETMASLTQVLAAVGAVHEREISVADLAALVQAGDAGAKRVVANAGRRIGRLLADLCNAFNPGALILGGELGSIGAAFTTGVQESINHYAQPIVGDAITAVPSSLGPRAEVLGAVALAIERSTAQPV